MAQPTANFLERNFRVFVAVPVFATVFCMGAFVGWRVTHPLPADVVAVAETPAPVQPPKLISAPVEAHAESELSAADIARSDERPERPPAPPESETPAPASIPPVEPVAPPPPAVKKKADPTYEDPYVVPKNKPFIDGKTFQSGQPGQPNDKPKAPPPKPVAKPEVSKPQKPANKAPANAVLKTVVLKNGRRIDVVSIAESNGTYVVENQFGATESFAKSEVSMILKR